MWKRAAVLSTLLVISACGTDRAPADPSRALLERGAASLGPSGGELLLLRYSALGHDGEWVHEVLTGEGGYAERRTHSVSGARWATGLDRTGAWIRIGDRPAHALDDTWSRALRSRAAVFRADFGSADAKVEDFGRSARGRQIAYSLPAARTIVLDIDRDSGVPLGFDWLTSYGDIETCDALAWGRAAGRPILRSLRCFEITQKTGRRGAALRLESATSVSPAEFPQWVPTTPRAEPRRDRTTRFSIREGSRIDVSLRIGKSELSLVLDTGAEMTVLSEPAAKRAGVVPTGEAPHFVEAPWLGVSENWVGVVDQLRVGGIERHGVRVLVMRDPTPLGGSDGLFGVDLMRDLVLDLDGPVGEARLVPRDRFSPAPSSRYLYMHGTGTPSVRGAVDGVARGLMILDTGSSWPIIVHDWGMAAVHPRQRGSEIYLGAGDASGSHDYVSEVAGIQIGPFAFPGRSVIARDREREKVGNGVALVGMGLMRHFRMQFDFRERSLGIVPGPSYLALERTGIEVVDSSGAAQIVSVAPGSPALRAGIEPGDHLESVGGAAVEGAATAERTLARARGAVPIVLSRRGLRLRRTLTLHGIE